MRNLATPSIFELIVALLLAVLLTIANLPPWFNWLRPELIVLVAMAAILLAPNRFGLGITFLVGLLLDILGNSFFGVHAIALIFPTYIILRFQQRIRLFSIWQQSLTIFVLIVIYRGMLFWLQALLTGQVINTFWYWFPAISSAIFWPILCKLINRRKVYD